MGREASARDRALLGVLLQGGLRRDEAARLRLADIGQDVRGPHTSSMGSTPRMEQMRYAAPAGETGMQQPAHSNGGGNGPSKVQGEPQPESEAVRLVRDAGLARLRVRGKGDKERTVYLADPAASDLAGWLAAGTDVGSRGAPGSSEEGKRAAGASTLAEMPRVQTFLRL